MSDTIEETKKSAKEITTALCFGRHPIKTNEGVDVTDSIFGEIPSERINDFNWLKERCVEWFLKIDTGETDKINVYVTGLTQALTTFVAVWTELRIFYHHVDFWHFNIDTKQYVCNKMSDDRILELAGIDMEDDEE